METYLRHPFDEFRSGRGRTAWLAFGITLLVHVLVILALPERLMPAHRAAKKEEAVTYEIDLVEPEEMRYVEANPEAPENEPDRSNQYSFRAQQAADENPRADEAKQPAVEGESESNKIVQGQLEQSPPVPPGVYSTAAKPGEVDAAPGNKNNSEALSDSAAAQPVQPPDFIRQKPVEAEGPGSSTKLTGEAKEVAETVDPEAPINIFRTPDQANAETLGGGSEGGAAGARPMPRERPRLAPELITGPLLKSKSSASRRGELAIDATFSEFGEYEQQFYAAIQAGWYQEIEFFQPIDTAARVHVRFRIKSDGTVDEVEAVKTSAGKIATVICETAISKRSPFRPWTKEMVKVFGKERWINVVFNYR